MFIRSKILLIGIVSVLTIYVYLVGKLSSREDKISGLILPLISFILSLYFKFKPYILPAENPNMKNAIFNSIFIILSLIGVVIYIAVKYFKQ